MRVSRARPAPIIEPPPSFEGLREVKAIVGKSLRVPATDRQLMHEAQLCCQAGGGQRSGSECLACARIVSIKPSPGRSFVTVRCLWTEVDVVEDVMTHAHAVVPVRASATVGRADEIAAREHVHHLLVVEHDDVIGTVCRCKLAEQGSRAGQYPVTDAMDGRIWTVPPGTSLGSVLDAMQLVGAGMLVVATGDWLLGVVTRRDLGVDDQGHAS